MRYIAYWHQPSFPGAEPHQYANLLDLKDGYLEYCKGVGIDECYGSVYGWTPEAWESALEFSGVGVPFDYPWMLVERGPRNGVVFQNC